jgi:hypothetical protein
MSRAENIGLDMGKQLRMHKTIIWGTSSLKKWKQEENDFLMWKLCFSLYISLLSVVTRRKGIKKCNFVVTRVNSALEILNL